MAHLYGGSVSTLPPSSTKGHADSCGKASWVGNPALTKSPISVKYGTHFPYIHFHFKIHFRPVAPPKFIFAPPPPAKIHFHLAALPKLIFTWPLRKTSFSPGRSAKTDFCPAAPPTFIFARLLRQNSFSINPSAKNYFRLVALPNFIFCPAALLKFIFARPPCQN